MNNNDIVIGMLLNNSLLQFGVTLSLFQAD